MPYRNYLVAFLSIVLIGGPLISSASSQEKTTTRSCTTSQSDRWICSGNRAWETGYLVAPKVMGRLTRIASERDGLRLLVERLRIERDALRVQRDQFEKAVDVRDVKLYEWESRERNMRAWTEGRDEVDWTERVVWVGGGVVTGVVVGVLVAVFVGGG